MSEGKRTEPNKRKLGQNDDVESGSQQKARKVNGEGTTVTEEEVDEFFAILRRIHAAVNYFKKGNGVGEGRNLTNRGEITNAENNSVTAEMTRVTNDAQKNMGLDLNADPAMDPDPF